MSENKIEVYVLPNGEEIKEGDVLELIDKEPLFEQTTYRVAIGENGKWYLNFTGKFPATHELKKHAEQLKLKK